MPQESDDEEYSLDYLTDEQLRKQRDIEHDKQKEKEENKVTLKDKVYLCKIRIIIGLLILIFIGVATTIPIVLSLNPDLGNNQ